MYIPLGPYFCDIYNSMYMRLVAERMGGLYYGGNWAIGGGRAVISRPHSGIRQDM